MGDPLLSIREVWKSYPLGETTVLVLKGIDLELGGGEMTAVMGPSGVGKSTLLNCVAGLDRPDRGVISLAGENVAALDDEARTRMRRSRLGIIFQFFNLIPNLTAIENVELPFLIDGRPPPEEVVAAALERVGMADRANHLPSQLSGGEMQLVSIARALVRRPALVLADEPTGNVNVATGRRIMELLREVVGGTDAALLLVTHSPEDAAHADRVVFMNDGVLVEGAELAGDETSSARIHDRLRELGI